MSDEQEKPDLSRAAARVEVALEEALRMCSRSTKTVNFPEEKVWRVAELILEEDDRLPPVKTDRW